VANLTGASVSKKKVSERLNVIELFIVVIFKSQSVCHCQAFSALPASEGSARDKQCSLLLPVINYNFKQFYKVATRVILTPAMIRVRRAPEKDCM
jgi:hypothetical protein